MTARDDLAELVNGRPVPANPTLTIGECYERDTAYQRADRIITAGWTPPPPKLTDEQIVRRYYQRVRESHPSPRLLAAVEAAEAAEPWATPKEQHP